MSALRLAAAHGDVESLKELLKGGANPCSTDESGLCALHYAVWNGYTDCVEYLLVNDLGHTSTRKGYTSCVDLTTKAGWSCLHLAALGGVLHIIPLLLAGGVDPDLVDASGLTARELARDTGNDAAAAALLEEPPSLEARRDLMNALEERRALVSYRSRPSRPLERDAPQIECAVVIETEESVEAHPADAFVAAEQSALERRRGCRLPVTPRDLKMPDRLILPFAKRNFHDSRRGKDIIHNLLFAADQADANLARRTNLLSTSSSS